MRVVSKVTEKQIESEILNFLEIIPGCFAWKNQSTGVFDPVRKQFRKSKNRFAINGTSDILGIYRGKFLAIEVKTPKNKLRTKSQDDFINTINSQGGIAFYATSVIEVKEKLGL